MLSRLSTTCIHLKSRGNPVLLRTALRSLHVSRNATTVLKRSRPAFDTINYVRFASTVPLKDLPPIPDAPAIPPQTADGISQTTELLSDSGFQTTVTQLAANGEPAFASLGLGGWSPVGLMQNAMEFMHCTLDIPWWGAIAIGTVCIRLALFPLVIVAQRNAALMHNNMPQMQVLHEKMTEARQTGNALDSARYGQEMMLFMKEKGCSPFKNMLVPLAQAPIFISVFMGLREMANLPVASMTTGGLSWFTDLTLPDPFYALPVITAATLYATIELGADSARLSQPNMQVMRYILKAMPLAVLAFTFNFPAAILWYWTCSNFISLGQVGILKIPAVRDYFKIERLQEFTPDVLPKKKKFVEGFKDSWQNMKLQNELQQRQQADELKFARAGKGALVKTYKYDPTKPRPMTAASKKS